MKSLVGAERYSRALLELAEERDQGTVVFHELLTVRDAVNERPELLNLLQSPLITRAEKHSLIEGILGASANSLSRDFLFLLVDKNHVDLFPPIVDELQRISRIKEGIQEITIVTAREMHESIIQLLEKTLAAKTGKKILVQTEVDPALLGGIQLRIGNRLIDGSIRAKLDALETQLRNVKVI